MQRSAILPISNQSPVNIISFLWESCTQTNYWSINATHSELCSCTRTTAGDHTQSILGNTIKTPRFKGECLEQRTLSLFAAQQNPIIAARVTSHPKHSTPGVFSATERGLDNDLLEESSSYRRALRGQRVCQRSTGITVKHLHKHSLLHAHISQTISGF